MCWIFNYVLLACSILLWHQWKPIKPPRNITLYVCEQTKTDTFGLLLFQGIGHIISLINVICIICIHILVFVRIYTVARGTRNSRNASSKSNSVSVTITTNVDSPSDGKTDQQSSRNHLRYTTCSQTQKMEHSIAFTCILLIGLFSFIPSRSLIAYESTHPNFWKNWQQMSSSKLNILLFLRGSYSLYFACTVFVYMFLDSFFRTEMKSLMGFWKHISIFLICWNYLYVLQNTYM